MLSVLCCHWYFGAAVFLGAEWISMRVTGEPTPGTMSSSSSGGSGNFLLVPIPEYPLLDCVPNKTVKIVVLGASNVGKTGTGNAGSNRACTSKTIK